MPTRRFRLPDFSPFLHDAPLLLAIFFDLVGFGMVIPDIQTRLEAFGARGWLIGLVLSSYFLVQILVSPLWGRISDRVGRKPVLLICGTLSTLSMVAYASANSIWLLLASRVFAGFAAANVVVAQAYLADAYPDESKRTGAMGRVGAAITAGLMLGPALGGWLASLGGNTLLGWVAAGMAGVGTLWILLAVPFVPPVAPSNVKNRLVVDISLLRDAPRLRPLFVLAVVAYFALACLEGTFGRLIHARLGYGPKEFGLIFGYESLLGVLVQTFLLGWATVRFPSRSLLTYAFLLQGVGLALTPFAPNLAALFGASTLYAVGAGLSSPTLSSLSSKATPAARQGEMFGLLQGTRSLGFLIGPTLGGILFDVRPDAPYLMAGFVLLAAAFLVRYQQPIVEKE